MRHIRPIALLAFLILLQARCAADPLLDTFRSAPGEYGPVPIWWWSGEKVEKERLAWQMERMAEGHVYNAIVLNLSPTSDIPSYLSPEWWDLMDFTLQEAEKLGMRIWFYDHFGFARSDAHERLMQADPSFRAESLNSLDKVVTEGTTAEMRVPDGARLAAAIACPIRADGSLGEGIDLSAQVKDGVHTWTPPEGNWRVMLFIARPADFDFSNAEACRKLMDRVHGEYERRYARYLGNVIPGSFQDELPATPRWSSGFLDEFRRRKGYDLSPHLPALFYDSGPQTARYRFDYRDVMAGMCEEAFFKPLFDWHERHGMICGMDQRVRDADPVEAQKAYTDYFRTMRWYGAPGQDQNGDAKPRSSIAHLYDRPRVWQEGFHSFGWGQTIEDIGDLLVGFYLRGANLYNPHAWYYSTAGSWWEFAPPCTSFRQPYWRHYRYFADYVARTSFLLSQGRHACDIAVLYPSTTIQADMTLDGKVSASARATSDAFWATLSALDDDRRDYDWIDESSVQSASMRDGRLRVSGESYRILVLPRTSIIRTQTAEKIRQFVLNGGQLVIVGDAPSGSAEEGRDDEAMRALFAELGKEQRVKVIPDAEALPQLLESICPRDHSPNVRCLHRVIGDRHFYFVARDDGSPRKVAFSARGRPEIWDPYTGDVHQVPDYAITDSGTEMTLDFDLSPGFFVVLGGSASSEARTPALPQGERETLPEINLGDEWGFRLYPTMDNQWGDFRLPLGEEPVPVETRELRYAEDPENLGLRSGWHKPGFDDSSWSRVIRTQGPYWSVSEAVPTSGAEDFTKSLPPESWPADAPDWKPVVFSRQSGIEKDPIYSGPRFTAPEGPVTFTGRSMSIKKARTPYSGMYGPKSRVSAEFINLGPGEMWAARYFSTFAYSPEPRQARLEIGCPFAKRVWLNGELVLDQAPGQPPVSSALVSLKKGWNRILVKLVQSDKGNMRVSLALADPVGDGAAVARWIWHRDPAASTVYFRKALDLPEAPSETWLNITCDDGYELYVNGVLVGKSLRTEGASWRSGESYRLPLKKGLNEVFVKGTNTGGKGGLLAWGSVVLPSGKRISIATDEHWLASVSEHDSERLPAVSLGTLTSSPWGLVRWGIDPIERKEQPRMPIRDMPGIVYDRDPQRTSAAWYRFDIPPGTRVIRLETAIPCEAYVNGKRQSMGRDGVIRLTSPAVNGGSCAVHAKQEAGIRGGAVFAGPVRFECVSGKITLGSWHEKGLQTYSGIGVYSKMFDLPSGYVDRELVLDLGAVRGTAEVRVNGKPAGVRIWKPYRFDIGKLVKSGANKVEIVVANTLGPHYSVGTPSPYVYPGQEVSGILSPVTVRVEGDR